MGFTNTVVARVLQWPVHRVLSGRIDLVRYTGRRSGRQFTTPTQYARRGDDVIIVVGKPETKTWWRNFETDGDIEVLVQGKWFAMTATAVTGPDDAEAKAPLLKAYTQRFPRASKAVGLDAEGPDNDDVVIVWCRPRSDVSQNPG